MKLGPFPSTLIEQVNDLSGYLTIAADTLNELREATDVLLGPNGDDEACSRAVTLFIESLIYMERIEHYWHALQDCFTAATLELRRVHGHIAQQTAELRDPLAIACSKQDDTKIRSTRIETATSEHEKAYIQTQITLSGLIYIVMLKNPVPPRTGMAAPFDFKDADPGRVVTSFSFNDFSKNDRLIRAYFDTRRESLGEWIEYTAPITFWESRRASIELERVQAIIICGDLEAQGIVAPVKSRRRRSDSKVRTPTPGIRFTCKVCNAHAKVRSTQGRIRYLKCTKCGWTGVGVGPAIT